MPTLTEVAGDPEIIGASFPGEGSGVVPPLVVAVMEKAGSVALERPSVTEIRMFDQVPALGALPLRRPEYVLNCAQLGLFLIE
ncbi:MAG: hypothetical protein GX535_02420 [Xanthomonadaceae bacterium]|nr:hypothetical protein [Xanthomonadaceae bacterium]